ncbi:MAG: hypothetical protein DI535_00400 [Citrobacter freundii]|nr:MAG: hypothetical protein DI535_00400 [Citrobacter freundii]
MKLSIKNLKPEQAKKFQNYFIRIVATLIVVVIISCSMTIDSVDQPSSINGGETLNATLHLKIKADAAQTSKLMIAILVPKMWNARQKATLTFTSDKTTGVQKMTAIPVGTPAPQAQGLDWPAKIAAQIGSGGNLINDWEWVAYYSDADYSVANEPEFKATVNVSIPTTTDNISFKMGYVVANSSDGLSGSDRYGSFFPGCLRVNGTGDLIDFCNPQLSSVEPRTALDNDIITLNFDGGVTSNALENAADIYLCAKAITTTGETLDACAATSKTKLTALGARRFRIDLWPREFFTVPAGKTLLRLEYFFTNADGSIKVGYGGLFDPFLYTFNCN